jgi:glycerophosphoryl diester phosphodiesterase
MKIMPRLPSYPCPNVLAHRMLLMGLPENTVLSLKEACNIGVDWVEFDIKVLKDGEMVSMHDGMVDRTTDGHGDITNMTYNEVKKLNAGKGYEFGFVPVPKVEEILDVLSKSKNYVRAEMHIHNLYEPEPLVKLLKKYEVQDRCYFNYNAVIIAEYHRQEYGDKDSLISLNVSADTPELPKICNDLDIAYLCVPHKILNADFIHKIHHYREKNPLFVHCYPVQNEKDWERMLNIGVDVIQTDFPEALTEYLESKGFVFGKK